jgi:type I restriction enzyme S subunit
MMAHIKNTKVFYNAELPCDWEIKYFEEVSAIDKESLSSRTAKDYEFDYISLSDVDSDDFKIETTRQIFASAPSRARRIVKRGDILMSTVRPNLQGFSLIRNEVKDLIASTGFAVITADKCNNEFLFQYLFSSGINRQFYQLLVGSNYPAINSFDVRKLKIPLPPLPEQKAIAQVLSTADAAIQTTEKLIAQKELRKKWLMQQLLTGKKRLKGFGGEWKEIHIRDIAKEVSVRNKSDKQLTVLSCTKYDGLVPSLEYFGRKIFADDVSTYKIVPKNHFAYATNHIEEGSIGYQGLLDEALISPMYTVFKTNGTVYDTFLFRLLKSHSLVYQYQNRMEGSIDRRGGLRWDAFSIIKIKLPSIEEQTAIAHVLQVADKEISLLKAKAEKLREQKKGLMQQLLTGKKRLKF